MMNASPPERRRYAAFLSYSHRDDATAKWLHRALERYWVPTRLVGQQGAQGIVRRRVGRIFRDREELPSGSDLGAIVRAAQADSDCLIALCSPEAARSRWVNAEILAWKQLGRGDRLLCLIVDGEPGASAIPGREHEECFAPALRYQLGADGELSDVPAEPIAADLRPGKDGKLDAKLKLISGLLGVGLDDLKRREQQRRVLQVSAAAAAAAVIAIGMGVLAVRATIASQAAERRQKQAEALVDFMLGDLSNKLDGVSRLDIMEAVNDQAMQYFRSLPPDDITDEALAQRSRTLTKIGRVRWNQGSARSAVEAFEASLTLTAELVKRHPDDVARLIEHAEALAWLGSLHWGNDEQDPAYARWLEGMRVLEPAVAKAPNNPEVMIRRYWMIASIGRFHEERRDLVAAESAYQSALALCRQMVAAEPDNREYQWQLGDAINILGQLAFARGDLLEALKASIEDDRIKRALTQADPADFAARRNRGLTLQILGRTLMQAGIAEPALERLTRAVRLYEEFVNNDQGSPTAVVRRAEGHMMLSLVSAMNGDHAQALHWIDQTLAAHETLPVAERDRVYGTDGWDEARLMRASALDALGRHAQAREQLDALLPAAAAIKLRPRLGIEAMRVIVGISVLRAAFARDDRQPDEVRAHATEAMALLDAHALDSAVPTLRALRVRALLLLDRREDAQALADRLRAGGFGPPDFVIAVRKAGLDYPDQTSLMNQITVALPPLD